MGNQLIVLNSFWDICDILSNCGQKRMHLFCEVWILLFTFLERLGNHAEQAKSKWVCIEALKSKQRRFGVEYLFFRCKNFDLALTYYFMSHWFPRHCFLKYRTQVSDSRMLFYLNNVIYSFYLLKLFDLTFRSEKDGLGFIFTEVNT